MTHSDYLTIAYTSFAVFLCWDYFAPRWALKNSTRAIALRARRNKPL
jgi:hypothetical protein